MTGQEIGKLLGGLDVETFVSRHWQKRPLLVRDAWPDLGTSIGADELAGLACQPDVTSRLVSGDGFDRPWRQRHGPFRDEDFSELPEECWTLLVQEVDRHVLAVARLLERFRFIPNWRFDDVMVSYAAPGGSVGPHVDRYDVFLLQATGRRRWRISDRPVLDEKLLPDTDLRVLEHFEPDREWVVDAGDLLYLPPGFAHHGVAIDDCMTYSIGFRAPDQRQLVTGVLGLAAETLDPDRLYADPDLRPPSNPGEIDPQALQRLSAMVREVLEDRERLQRWIGRLLTEPQREHQPPDEPAEEEDWRRALERGRSLTRSAVSHFAYVVREDGGVDLFVGGRDYRLAPPRAALARLLCGRDELTQATLEAHLDDPAAIDLLSDLHRRGFLLT